MFISLMIIIIVLNDFLALVYAKERLELNDTAILAKKIVVELNDEFNNKMAATGLRLIIAIGILIFWIYAIFFIPYLVIPVILNIIITIISSIILYFINKTNSNLELTFTKRLWLIRINAIISLIIWFPYFSPLLALVF